MNGENGFSLLEVLIAMVILSSGLIALASMQIVAIQINTSASQLTRATTLVQDKIEELMALPFGHPDLSDATPVGTCQSHDETNPPQGYTLSWCVDTDANSTSKTVDVTATWHSSGDTKSFSLSFVRTIFQP
jgi:type IV pilus assembly protein PilV